jgi:hypothetical protein
LNLVYHLYYCRTKHNHLNYINGKYRFDNLDSGKYKVIFEKPAGLIQTGTNTTEDDKDADGGSTSPPSASLSSSVVFVPV